MEVGGGLGIQLHEPGPFSTGTFFFNKVQLNDETERTEPLFWEPPHLKGTSTKVLSFEEVAPKDGLEKALVVNSCKLSEILDDCFYFLPQATLTVVCFPETGESPPNLERTIKVCPHHKATQFTYLEGAVSGTICGCGDCSRLTIVHPHQSRKLRTKLLLLRYKDYVRIVIPSGNLGSLFWQKLGLFGWFIDLKLNHDVPDAGEGEPVAPKSDFELELREVLRCLKVQDADKLLEKADFRNVLPAIHLVGALPQWRKSKLLAGNLVLQLVQPVRQFCKDWQRLRLIQSHAINKDFEDVKRLFELGPPEKERNYRDKKHHHWEGKKMMDLDASERETVKIIYPSTDCVGNALKSTPNLTMADVARNTNLKYLDWGLDLKLYLHTAEDSRVIPYANVYVETFTKPSEDGALGWMLFGSATFGNVSWGLYEKMDRYELSVAIVPFLKDNVIHAVDLRKIGFHFTLNPPAYDRALCPVALGHQMYRCQGILTNPGRKGPRGSFFVDDIPEAEKYQLGHFPSTFEKHPISHAIVYRSTWETSFINDFSLAHPGTFVDTLCRCCFSSRTQKWYVHVSFVISAHKTLSSLLRLLGKEDEAKEMAEIERIQAAESLLMDTKLLWSDQSEAEQAKPQSNASYHRQKFKLLYGEGTEEDFEKYWKEQFEQTYVFPTMIPDGDYQNYKAEEEFDVNPWTSKMDDTVWLERQVRKMCNPLPNLIGQFSVPYLKCNFAMLGHKMFPGLDNIENAAQKRST